MLVKKRTGQLRTCRLDVDGGRQQTSLQAGGKDIPNGLEHAVDEAALGRHDSGVLIGLVEDRCENKSEPPLPHPHLEMGESHTQIVFDIVAGRGRDVGSHHLVDRVQQQRRCIRPMTVDCRARNACFLGDANCRDGAATFSYE